MPLLDAFLPNAQATVTATAGAAPVAVALPPGAYLEIQNAGTGIVYFEMGPVGTVVDAATGTPILPGGARCFRRHVHTRSLVISLIAPAGGGAVYITGGVGAPGTRRRGYARAGAAAPSVPAPIFFAPLTNSLIPTTAGNPAFTFTRATLAYVQDFEGILRSAAKKINEARFQGARRVENAANLPGSLSEGVVWATSGTTPPAVGATAFGGKTNASFVTFPAGAASGADSRANTYSAGFNSFALVGSQLRFSGYFALSRPLVGAETIVIVLDGGANYGTFAVWTAAAQPGAALTRYTTPAPTAPIAVNGAGFYMNPGAPLTAPITVYSWGYQVESVGGQSNQAPGEYVSVGVLAAPYNGAGVDGVQYFATANGNSVDANGVITEAVGAAIPAATMLGFAIENISTNLCIQSQAFDHASWLATNSTITANNIAAPDGSLTADLFTDNATNAIHAVNASTGITGLTNGGTYTLSLYAKAGTLTWLQMFFYDTTNTLTWANFNLQTGTVGNKGTGATASIVALPNGWYRCSITVTVGNTTSKPYIYSIDSNQNIPGPSYAGTGQTMFLWGAQVEAQPVATSYIPTTIASVTRNADVLQYSAATNLDPNTGTAYVEAYPTRAAVNPNYQEIVAFDINDGPLVLGVNARFQIQSGGGSFTNPTANSRTLNAINKCASAWSASTSSVCLNNGAVGAGSFFHYTGATLNVCGVSVCRYDGNVRNLKFWNARLTDAQLGTITT